LARELHHILIDQLVVPDSTILLMSMHTVAMHGSRHSAIESISHSPPR
jgi:hypothetical protein